MLIQTKEKTFYVLSEWIPRWSFLRDYKEFTRSSILTWDYTSDESISAWVDLNKRMDTINALPASGDPATRIKYTHLIPMEPAYATVRMMNPGPCEALLYLHASRSASQGYYLELLVNTGRYIREKRVSLPYTTYQRYEKILIRKTFAGILGVSSDPVFMPREDMTAEDYDKFIEAALSLPYYLLTGIVHRAFQLHMAKMTERGIERDPANIPWFHIDWTLVGSHVLGRDNIYKYKEAISDLYRTYRTAAFDLILSTRYSPFNLEDPPAIVSLLSGKMSPRQLEDGYYGEMQVINADGKLNVIVLSRMRMLKELICTAANNATNSQLLFYCKEVLGLGVLLGLEKRDVRIFQMRSIMMVSSPCYLANFLHTLLNESYGKSVDYYNAVQVLVDGMGKPYAIACQALLERLSEADLRTQVSDTASGTVYDVGDADKLKKRIMALIRYLKKAIYNR